jgi:hypothetical protein
MSDNAVIDSRERMATIQAHQLLTIRAGHSTGR